MKKKKVMRLIHKVLMEEGLIPNPYIYNPSNANPYTFLPPQSIKIADEMKKENERG